MFLLCLFCVSAWPTVLDGQDARKLPCTPLFLILLSLRPALDFDILSGKEHALKPDLTVAVRNAYTVNASTINNVC